MTVILDKVDPKNGPNNKSKRGEPRGILEDLKGRLHGVFQVFSFEGGHIRVLRCKDAVQ